MKRQIFIALMLPLLCLVCRPAWAARPGNDNFASSWVIAGPSVSTNGSVGTTTTTYATVETGEPNHGGNAAGMRRSVWFHWTAPTNGVTRLDTLGSVFDTVLAVYTGTNVTNLTLVAQNDNASASTNASQLYFSATQGTRYEIAVAAVTNVSTGTGIYQLRLKMMPAVVLTAPLNESASAWGDTVYLHAEATAPAGTVSRVDFYREGTFVMSDTSYPYDATYARPPLGTNSFYAVVTDSASQVWTSAVVRVHVMQTGVLITSPTNGASVFGSYPVAVSADATYGGGTVSRVDFYANGNLIGRDSNALYGVVWTNVSAGSNLLTAIMTSSAGTTYTSPPVAVTVIGDSLVRTGAVWKYLDNGSDQGTAWRALGFNDSAWASGPAELGYGDTQDGRPEATVIGYGPSATNKYITTYFRRSFTANNVILCTNLILRVLRDDGAVVYLNGVEAARFNMPAGTIGYLTTAPDASDDGTIYYATNISPALLAEGTNVLAVEVHQSGPTSSDLSFDLDLTIQRDVTYNLPPVASLVSPTNGASLVGPDNLVLLASASDANGSVAKVDFYSGSQKIGTVTSPPYAMTWSNVAPGTYSVKVVATDNQGATNTPSANIITVWATGSTQWMAFNDYLAGPGTSPNATTFSPFDQTGGSLLDIATGNPVTASLLFTESGASTGSIGSAPGSGTPAYETFHDYVNLEANVGAATIIIATSDLVTYQFSGLNPNRRYNFRGTGYRGQTSYTNRWALCSLLGAAYFTPAHTSNVVTSAQQPAAIAVNQAAMLTGDNTRGDMVGWDNISPGSDGVVEVTATQYAGPAPGNDAPAAYAYALTALRLTELSAAPTVTLVSPANGSTYTQGVDITLSATAAGCYPVTNVDFFHNNSYLGGKASAPYSFVWHGAPVGSNAVMAVATDADGARSTSAVAMVTVKLAANPLPPVIASVNPAAGVIYSNLTSIQVTFSEPVSGVNATDFLVNGVPATAVTGSEASYTFSFALPALGAVQIGWAAGHGIADYDSPPKPFDATATNATWSYTLVDITPPTATSVVPTPGSTVRSLTGISVLFSERVTGVDAGDLTIDSQPASSVSGSGAGPYLFQFSEPANGPVSVQWAAGHGIKDYGQPPNAFAGGAWSYVLDTNANFVDRIVINEVMYRPSLESTNTEYIELANVGKDSVNLDGWRFSKGISFAFSNVSIPSQGYLVVVASSNAFKARYPGVTNFVGDWTGTLGNGGERIELQDALGQTVDSLVYGRDGDWGVRLRGMGEERVMNLTRSGTNATATLLGYSRGGDTVIISGADQPDFNGVFQIRTSRNPSYIGFTYTVPSSAPAKATGTIVCRVVTNYSHAGWAWSSRANGLGSSAELINPGLPRGSGQNWGASTVLNGTPGRANSVAATNIAPLISEAKHWPLVPRSSDEVVITARVQDERVDGVTVTLNWRVDGAGAFTAQAMKDDGSGHDAAAGDGVFGAVIPAKPNNAIVEFYLEARDLEGNVRTWPAPALDFDGSPIQSANALYQVDDTVANTYAGAQPVYKFIMKDAERAELQSIPGSQPNCDAAFNATFIAIDGAGAEVRYLCSLRNRGAGTRSASPPNYKVSLLDDQPWHGVSGFNLNSQYTHCQLAGCVLANLAGLSTEAGRVVQLRINNVNRANSGSPQYGSYIHLESIDGTFVDRHFPANPAGNVYRCMSGNHDCALNYIGSSYLSYVNLGYSKQSNLGQNDWSDFLNLCAVLNTNTTDSAIYAQSVRQVADVEEWMRYMASFTLALSRETSFATGAGDDYTIYRGTVDRRFMLLAHDWDTILNQGDTTGGFTDSIFRMCPVVNGVTNYNSQTIVLDRFMLHPDFVPFYYQELKRQAETVFAPTVLRPALMNALGGWIPQSVIESMVNFGSNRAVYVLSQIPLSLSVSNDLDMASGYYHSTNSTVLLWGQANAIETRSVSVNGQDASWLGWQARWTNTVSLLPGLNQVLIQAFNSNRVEFDRTSLVIWYDNASGQNVSGAITANTTWNPTNGPYKVTGNVTINSGVTLTILPGTPVYLGSGVNLAVASGGRLLAQGTELAPIRFTRSPGSSANWGHITINGTTGSPESKISYAYFEFNTNSTTVPCIQVAGGTVSLDHLSFGNTAAPYLYLDGASFVVSDSVFPRTTASFEAVHGTGGVKSGGRGIFLRNFFGPANGYNDVIDFTGGNRPGQPIVQFIDNVFTGTGDDMLDLDGTDAWIEGNLFMHAHKNGSPDTASAVSGGADSTNTSEITIIGNIFYDCDHAAMAKEGDFFTLLNNTIVRQTHAGGLDSTGAVVCLADSGTTQGAGMYLEGNILQDIEQLTRNATTAAVTFSNNLMPVAWSGSGGGNSVGDPGFVHVPQLAETTNFSSWAEAQVLKEWFSLRSGSIAKGTGPNGSDKGALNPIGAFISGEPASPTSLNSATLKVGLNRTGNGIPTAGWPNGSGYTHYKWRLDGTGAWSAETPIGTSITVSGLAGGGHYVEVAGKRDCGWYQDDSAYGSDATVTRSRTWTVDPAASLLRLNEILAANSTALIYHDTTPDLVELHNAGPTNMNLAGIRLTDDPAAPDKFIFPAGATIPAGGYVVLYANKADGTPGYHLGFNLNQEGDSLYLFDRKSSGGALLDSIEFGLQLTDLSIGRLADGGWGLCQPTFGAANQGVALGDPSVLKINEWLTLSGAPGQTDFIELYNPGVSPVALGGLFLTDNPVNWPDQCSIPPLSYIAAGGFTVLLADGQVTAGPRHLNFKLTHDLGMIGLFDQELNLIDQVVYHPQNPDISQGRSPNGGSYLAYFGTPTPGAPNPLSQIGDIVTTTIPLLGLTGVNWRYNQTDDLTSSTWYATNYDDSAWPVGPALLAFEDNAAIVPLIGTTLLDPRTTTPPAHAYYFRTTFAVKTNLTGFAVTARLRVDDGAIIYLNGSELTRLHMPAGDMTYTSTTGGLTPSGSEALVDETFVIPLSRIVTGTNYLGAQVHQSSASSSDIVWGMGIDAIRSVTNFITSNPVVLNEVFASNDHLAETDGSTPDWVELYNPSSQQIDIGDLSLSDDTLAPRRWVIPGGTKLSSHGFLRVRCDGSLPASATNTGFGLKATGGSVYVFDAQTNGGSLLNSVTYGLQTPDFSIGRVPDGTGAWVLSLPTRNSANIAATLGDSGALKVNEWMANPASGGDWFEVYNPNAQPVAIGGLHFSDDLTSAGLVKYPAVPALSFIGATTNAYARFWADGDLAAGADHAQFQLKASGEAIAIATATGDLIDGVAFGSQSAGISEGRFPDGSATVVVFAKTPSPGESNYRLLDNVVINEVHSHSGTNMPMEDAIELRNLSSSAVDLSGWFLSNARGNLQKYRIPEGTVLPASGYRVFYEYQFNSNAVINPDAFGISSKGDQIYLAQAGLDGTLTGYRAEVDFGAAELGVSFGRYVTSDSREEFVAMSALSFGTTNPATVAQFRTGAGGPNPYPKVGPVVISEIMYHPPDLGTNDNVRDEFIELHNLTATNVPLYDPARATNTWRLRNAVDFDFPAGVSLTAGGYLLVVSFDPALDSVALAEFRAAYGLGTNVPIYGPYSGQLGNKSETIELKKPTTPDTNDVPYAMVERVKYSDSSPWPAAADGTGASLQRAADAQFANDPANWLAATATPGAAPNLLADADGDGMPDAWESSHGLDPHNASDKFGDPDHDGLTNYEEYLAGTDPQNAASSLRFDSVTSSGTGSALTLSFRALANRSYAVDVTDQLKPLAWTPFYTVPATSSDRVINVPVTASGSNRFYRIRIP